MRSTNTIHHAHQCRIDGWQWLDESLRLADHDPVDPGGLAVGSPPRVAPFLVAKNAQATVGTQVPALAQPLALHAPGSIEQ